MIIPLALLLFAVGAAAFCPNHLSHNLACPQGCYHASGILNSDGTRTCEPVGAGYYSPPNDNLRYICSFGTYSASDTAHVCSSCPPGTHSSSAGASTCEICPRAHYSNLPGSIFCSPCNPEVYNDEGSNAIQVWSGTIFCAITVPSPTSHPLASPTMTPTGSSTNISVPDAQSAFEYSTLLNNKTSATLKDEINDQENDDSCSISEYEWHTSCTSCPSTFRTFFHPFWITTMLVATITVLHLVPPNFKTIVWLGIDYVQFTAFLGIVQSTHSPHAILQHFHRWVISIFTLDVDAGFSWQCIWNLSPTMEHLLVLLLPMLVICFLWISSRVIPGLPIGSWLAIGFSLAQFKLVMTSFEALHCSDKEGSSQDHVLSTLLGLFGLFVYGCLIPLWILWQRYLDFNNRCITHLGFDSCWWWTGISMLRKLLVAAVTVLLSKHPAWILTFFLLSLMTSEFFQRFSSHIPADDTSHNRWLRTNTMDTIFQASIIGLTGLSFLALAIPPETRRGEGIASAVVFLIIWVCTVGYWMTAIMFGYSDYMLKNQMPEVASTEDVKSTSSASNQQGKHHHHESTSRSVGWQSSSDFSASDAVILHSLSLVPRPGPGDDLDIESILDDEEIGFTKRSWRNPKKYSEWVGNYELKVRKGTRGRPIKLLMDDYQSIALPSDDSVRQPAEGGHDDASTLTDNHSYVPKKGVKRPKNRPPRFKFVGPDSVASFMEVSGDETPTIFSDGDETPIEYRVKSQYHDDERDVPNGHYQQPNDDTTELWIDVATGQPIQNRYAGRWADAYNTFPPKTTSSLSSNPSKSRPIRFR